MFAKFAGCGTRTTLAAAALAGGLMLLGPTGHASAWSTDDCVTRRMDDGETRTRAIASCLAEARSPTTTLTSNGGGGPDATTTSTEDGTPTGLLIAVGVGGLVVGSGLAMFLRKGASTTSHGAAYQNAPPPMAPTAPAPMHAPGSPMPMPGQPDRSGALVTALVDLSDRVSSGALRAEIFASLARAGVQVLQPAQGDVFDANRMRGVGSSIAPDPSWIGRVAATERAGFVDGATLLRLPEVLVYTAAG